MNQDTLHIFSLPDDTLLTILSLLDDPDDRCHAALTCTRFRDFIKLCPRSLSLDFNGSFHKFLTDLNDCAAIFPCINNLRMRSKTTKCIRFLGLNGFGPELLEAVALKCPKLESFSAFGCDRVTTTGWKQFGQDSRFLKSLEIRGSNTPHIIFSALETFTALQSLTLIILSFPRDFFPICHSSSLTSLTISNITDPILCTLTSGSSSFPSLQSLTLMYSSVSSSLVTLSSFTSLTTLSFDSFDIMYLDLEGLARSLHSLSGLSVVGCRNITDEGVQAIASSNPALRSLSLQLNLTTRKTVNAMLDCCKQLETLSLASFDTCQRILLTDLSFLETLTLHSFQGKLEGLIHMLVRPQGSSKRMGIEAFDRDDPQSAELIHPPLKSLTLRGFAFYCRRAALNSAAQSGLPIPKTSLASIDEALGGIQWQAAFKDLKKLTLINSSALGEEGLVALLQACSVLKELGISQNEDVSDTVIHSCHIETLERLALVECTRVTAAGVEGVFESFPRLCWLKVEEDKLSSRTRQALMQANVIVKRV